MLGTEKPKVVGNDRLENQRTLEDLILTVLANEGEPSLSAMVIVVDGGANEAKSMSFVCTQSKPSWIDLHRDHISSVSAESNLASAEMSQHFALRSSTNPLYAFDPEIELTLRRLRKIRNTTVNTSSSIDSVIDSDQFCTDNSVASSNIFTEPGQMENHDRTLKELATPDVVYQPWCIQYPQLEPA
ncbi:hypothetical protein CR513_56088, partial [Mucuna pruriens]